MSDISGNDSQLLASVPIRPLSKGMHRDKIAQLLEPGAMVDVRGYRVTPYGLETDECFVPAQENRSKTSPFPYLKLDPLLPGEYVEECDVFTDSSGASVMFAVTNTFIYTSPDLAVWTPVPWVRSRTASAATAAGRSVVDADADFVLDKVRAGQYAVFHRSGGGRFVSLIASVPDATHLVLSDDIPADLASLAYTIHAPLTASDPLVVQYAKTPSFVLLVDGSSTCLQAFDGHYVTPYVPWFEGDDTHTPICGGARTVAYVAGRLILGGTTEPTGRRRWRWSSAIALDMFNEADYCDAVSAQGSVIKITASEDYPVIFLDDGLIIGQPWGMDASSTDPWLWRPVASGGAAPIGPRAFAATPGQIFFLGPDDVYAFSPLKRTEKGDYVVQPVQCPVRDTFNSCIYRGRTIMRYDPFNQRIVFALPASTVLYNDLYSWAYMQNEWAHRGLTNLSFTTVTLFASRIGATWKTWLEAGYIWQGTSAAADGLKRSWLSWATGTSNVAMVVADAACVLYMGTRQAPVDKLVNQTASDLSLYPITRSFETGDLDFGLPDEDKSYRKFSLRLRSPAGRSEAIVFRVEGSTDKGRTWKPLGDLLIPPAEDEDEVHFAMRGTVIRFRVSSTSTAAPWVCEEYVVRVRRAGRQVIRH